MSNGISEYFNKAVFQKDADRLANIEDPEQSELVLFGMHISQIQFNIPSYFTHIETSQSVGGVKGEYPGKTT